MNVDHEKKRLHFMHIFKTGGTSLWNFLQFQFALKDVCPALFLNDCPTGTSPHYVLKNIPEDTIRQYRFFMGHLGWIPRTLFPDDEVETITFLRDPVERVLSEHAQIRRWIDKIAPSDRGKDIDTYIEDSHYLANRQTLYFCLDKGFGDDNTDPLFDALNFDLMGLSKRLFSLQNEAGSSQLTELAMSRLHSCSFVGITEHYADSLLQLCEQYDWILPSKIPKENASPSPTKHTDISSKTRDRILELNQLDVLLYQEAIKIYEDKKRIRVFFDREDMKNKFYNTIPTSKEVNFTFEDRVIGEGWGPRELSGSNFLCWSTALKSTLIFSIDASNKLLLSFYISNSVVSGFESKLTMFANDYPIPLSHQAHPEGGFLFKGIIPTHTFNRSNKILELSFSMPNLICPMDIKPESDDTRKLGFICKCIQIKPIRGFAYLIYCYWYIPKLKFKNVILSCWHIHKLKFWHIPKLIFWRIPKFILKKVFL